MRHLKVLVWALLLAGACIHAQAPVAPVPRQSFSDANGLPLASGKVCSYQANSTTPATTYSDKALSVALPNPIILDAGGHMTTGWYWQPISYKIVVLTAASTTTDCVTGTMSVIFSTDNVPATYQGIAAPVYNVLAYGATGNGTSDDTLGIQLAIAACSGASGTVGGTIYLPVGTYKTSSALAMTVGNCQLVGAGKLTTIISASNATQDIIDISGATNNSVTDLALTSSVTKTGGAAINVTGGNYGSHFRNLYFLGAPDPQYQCLNIGSAQQFWIENDVFQYCQQFSVGVQSTALFGTGVIDNNYFVSIASGVPALAHVYQQTGGGLRVVNNTFVLAGGAATAVSVTGGGGFIDENVIYNSAAGGTGITIGAGASNETVGQNNSYTGTALTTRVANASTSSTLQGEWVPYTPVWSAIGTAPVLGNGTLTGRYRVVQKTVTMSLTLTYGSTTTGGTGGWEFTYPLASASSTPDMDPMPAVLLLSGTGAYPAIAANVGSTTLIYVVATGAVNGITQTVPFTWIAGSSLNIEGTYLTP
jgi:hypothetical protein